MDTAKDLPIGFHAVSDYPAAAVWANRRERVDCALEAIEGVTLAGNDYFKRLVIFIFADFAYSHTYLFRASLLSRRCPVLFAGSNMRFRQVEIARESDSFRWGRL